MSTVTNANKKRKRRYVAHWNPKRRSMCKEIQANTICKLKVTEEQKSSIHGDQNTKRSFDRTRSHSKTDKSVVTGRDGAILKVSNQIK